MTPAEEQKMPVSYVIYDQFVMSYTVLFPDVSDSIYIYIYIYIFIYIYIDRERERERDVKIFKLHAGYFPNF